MAASTYSPRLRTAVVLGDAGTAGAYQAGVLRALTEAGVKIDLVAAHGAGIPLALAAGIDGGARLWDPAGPWGGSRLRAACRWRPGLRLAGAALGLGLLVLLSPLVVLVLAGAAYGVGTLAALAGLSELSARLIGFYGAALGRLFDPPILPTLMPRVLAVAMLVVFGVLLAAALAARRRERTRRARRGAFWWRLVGSPIEATEPAQTLTGVLWGLVRGASPAADPARADFGRRYADLLADNFGQPGFRDILVAVHDLDARRDLVGALVPPVRREALLGRRPGGGPREAEAIDLAGPGREIIADFLDGGLRLPVVHEPHRVTFPAESYWRGESHRWCDRPGLAGRLVDEVAALGVEQVILVGAAALAGVPHGLRAHPGDLRGRMGEVVRSMETAALDEARQIAGHRCAGVFVIRPDHNPIGPFDFAGVYDEASDRTRTVGDLLQQGYEDAYRQFIEPAVAAGERADHEEAS